jgi:hypothetical protein
MSAGGALVAIMAAAHARRVQQVTDACRLGHATAPERARSLEALGVGDRAAEAAELARAGVLVPGAAPSTWYLDEAAVIARRRSGASGTQRALVVLLLATALALGAGVLLATWRS